MIGVVGPGTTGAIEAGTIVGAIEDAGETPRSGPAADVLAAGPDAVVAVGESGVIDLARSRDVSVPILAVGIEEGSDAPTKGLPGVSERAARSAVATLASGAPETVEHPVLGVDVGDERVGRAVFDAMVVTSDPGQISEYRIVAGADLGAVRADGVVVATPAGSHGYARSAGGPRIVADAAVATVVPVAAFTMAPEQWVVDLDARIEITSERDVDVSLLLDDDRRAIPSDRPVSIGVAGTLPFVVSSDSGG